MINAVISGSLGKDSVVRDAGGTPVLSFSVACKSGKEETTWVSCSMFGKRGQSLEQYLKKGSKVCCAGVLRMREYSHNGEKKTSLDLTVDQLNMLGGGSRRDDDPDF